METANYNLVIEQGATYRLYITWYDDDGTTVVDLSAYTAKLTIRSKLGSSDIIHQMTETDGLTLAATNPSITILIPADTTAEFDFQRGVWDLFLTNGSEVVKLLKGLVVMNKSVSDDNP